ncbi:MAG: LamG-like jellyroll fold domain-containing protein [Flavobacteriales bacterium]
MKQIGLFLVLLFFGSHAVLSQVPSYVDTNGLVGWWPFDGNANDFSSFANPSVNYGVTFDSVRNNNCNRVAQFKQDTSCSTRIETNLSRFNFTNEISIAFWLKSDWSGCQTGGGVRYLAIGSAGYPTGIQIIESNTVFSYFDFSHAGLTTSVNSRFEPINLKQWNHVTYTLGNDSARFYLNGVKIKSVLNDLDTFAIGGPTVIGMLGMNFQFHGGFQGFMDDLGIWNRKLDQVEIIQLFNQNSSNIFLNILPHDTITSCNQDSVLLDAGAGFASYNWSNGDSIQTTYAKATGMYSVQVTDSNGCSAEDSVFVSVINDSIIQNDTIICMGDSVSLGVSTIIGTYKASQVFCNGTPTAVVDVTNPITGRTWMDRNLGASRAATSSGDAAAYGDLYQWGRGSDGHQCRTSSTNSALSSTDQPNHGDFILVTSLPENWLSLTNNNLWQGVNGINNPCPNGYRVPSSSELNAERMSWSSNNSLGAFNSPLKLTDGGVRVVYTGGLNDVGRGGNYWSSTVYNNNQITRLDYLPTQANLFNNTKGYGMSVRCIKEIPSVIRTLQGNKSYQWSTGDTTSSISVSPDSTTTYYVTISNGIHSCVDSVMVFVNNPQFQFSQDTITSCNQDSVLLDAGAGFASYYWSNGDSTQTTYAKATGMYSVQVTDTNGCSAEDSVFVSIINDSIIQNDTTICKEDSVSLSVSQPMGQALTVCNGNNLPSNLQTGLVGYWPFCGNANDESGNGNNGTVQGPFLTNDRFGNANSAYEFDGIDDFISIPTEIMNGKDTVSSSSYRVRFMVDSISSSEQTIWNKDGYWREMRIRVHPDSSISLLWAYHTPKYYDGIKTLPGKIIPGNWYDVVIVLDSNNGEIFINGLKELTYSQSVGNSTISFSQQGSYCATGGIECNRFGLAKWGPGISRYFDGKLDEIAIWNRALSHIEVQQLSVSVSGTYSSYGGDNMAYQWSTGDTTSSISVSPDSTTTYYVTISNGIHSCVDSVTVFVNNPQFQLSQDTITSCNQDSVLLDAGAGFASYNWSNGDSAQTTYAKVTGVYSVDVTDTNGCTAKDSLFVSIINDSILQNDTTICKGDSVSFSVNLISLPLNFNGCVSSSAPYFGTWSLITPIGIYTNLIRKDSIFYSRSNNDVFKSNFINGPWISLNFATQIGITSPGNLIDMLEFDWAGNLFVSTAHNDLYSFDGINWNSKGLSGF